jgi:OOP family OmpA-OmpF porin
MKKSLLTLAVSAALLGAAGAAQAGSDVGQWTVGAGGIWTATDGDRGVDDGAGFNYSIGYAMNENWDFSLNGFSSNHDVVGATYDREIKGLTVDFDRIYRRDAGVSPFFTLGVGVVDQIREIPSIARKDVVGKVGVGLLGTLVEFGGGNKLQLKMDAAMRASAGKHINDIVLGVGLQMAFGAAEKPAPVVAAPPPPPPPPPAPPPPPPRPAPPPVAAAPPPPPPPPPPRPPADDDRDGVVNTADRCPTTPAGDRVDTNGCSLRANLKVFFDTNSAVLKAESFAELDNMAKFLADVPNARGEVEGHTDSQGADAYNQALSQRRAEAVRKYLVDKGVAGDRLQARGYGESKPEADNNTADGRAQNRRVVFQRTDVK